MEQSSYTPSTLFPPNPSTVVSPSTSHTRSSPTGSSGDSNNTFLMTASPVRNRKSGSEGYKPKIITTVGAKPACLVNASVTYVGNDQIYAFGGFDQYTDEVYNHVLRLNLTTRQWNLVDNYGDIPGVRMGHTANLWDGDKLLVFGGENEHRQHLCDIIVFDLKTAYWTQPELQGPAPRGRARHSAVIHDGKLYISGGQTGHDSVLDDICYLDLKTWTWSRSWRFVPRYDHASWIWNGRLWIFGGINDDMEKSNEIWWLDLRGSPGFDSAMAYGTGDRQMVSKYRGFPGSIAAQAPTGSTGYTANSGVQSYSSQGASGRSPYVLPGSISSLKFHSSPNLPSQAAGMHFHIFSSGCMLDFVTPMEVTCETSLSSLELDSLRWQKLADGKEIFSPTYRWHYCTINAEGTNAWLLGSPVEPTADGNGVTGSEYLSDVLAIDLRKYGILGNELASTYRAKVPSSDANFSSPLTGIGADLSTTFDISPESGGDADFIITADPDDVDYDASPVNEAGSSTTVASTSRPIYVHRLILQARWPHFKRMWSAQMAEFHSKKMHIPEPYSAVRAFLYYLYTDSIDSSSQHGPTLVDVAGMLVMSNVYDMPRLRLLCVHRLGKELDIEHAAIIWERAGTATEEWLKRRAATFCLQNWGRIVRTAGFKSLSHQAIIDLCSESDTESRVLNGDELDELGILGRSYGISNGNRKRSLGSANTITGTDDEPDDEVEDDGMDVN